MTSVEYAFRYIMVGDSNVGKTCLCLRFLKDQFVNYYDATIGVSFETKIVTIDAHTVKLQVWDTAGSEAFKSVTKTYYRGAHCAFLVYDITKRSSFEHVRTWLDEIKESSPLTVTIILVGNKSDLKEEREVEYEEGKAFADNNGMDFIETSAKTSENVKNAFENSVRTIISKVRQDPSVLTTNKNGVVELRKDGGEQKGYLNYLLSWC